MRYVAAAAAAALVLAGCGGGTHTPPPRKLPHALAQTWAQQADAIAARLSVGDGCSAQRLAQSLRDDVIGAEARLPARYRSTLLSAVNDLADRITCTVTVVPAGPPGHEKPKHHDHGKGHGDG